MTSKVCEMLKVREKNNKNVLFNQFVFNWLSFIVKKQKTKLLIETLVQSTYLIVLSWFVVKCVEILTYKTGQSSLSQNTCNGWFKTYKKNRIITGLHTVHRWFYSNYLKNDLVIFILHGKVKCPILVLSSTFTMPSIYKLFIG